MDEDEERKAFISRIGTFFLIMGVLSVIIFIASDMGQETYFSYFFIGIALLFVGFIFKRMGASAPTQSNRFQGIRTYQKKRRDAKAKKEASKNFPKKK